VASPVEGYQRRLESHVASHDFAICRTGAKIDEVTLLGTIQYWTLSDRRGYLEAKSVNRTCVSEQTK
jgi:hypothetical protein